MSYEVCSLCQVMHLTGDMRNISVIDARTRKTMTVRICSSCLNQKQLYIQAAFAQRVEAHKDLVASAVTVSALVIISAFYGAILGGAIGLTIAIAGIVAGAVALAGLVIASCTQFS